MAATVKSAWPKAGAWALDSEEHEEELNKQQQENPTQAYGKSSTTTAAAMSDFPDLMTAAATKTKKKKAQTVSLSEFVTGKSNNNNTYQANKGLTVEDMINLPTGPRQRTAEEMERARSNGFRSYDRSDSSSRWGPGQGQGRVNDEDGGRGRPVREPLGPSRADENDDWAATKKPGSGFGRRDSGGGFFDGTRNSRADEVDSWASNKKEVRRGNGFDRVERKTGFESSGVADSVDTWARKKDVEVKPRGGGSSFDSLRDRRIGNESSDSDTWGRKREEVNNNNVSLNNSRPKLNLQPRKLPVGEVEIVKPSKGTNPFGDARPREEVLKEKGEDWKEIDEKLEATKIKDLGSGDRFKRGGGKPRSNEDSTERTWRKNQTEAAAAAADVPPPSGENSENEQHTEEPEEEKEDAQK
uniref:eukaryotic translation initiation factor 4B3 n=1 Tax=Erigeron canadensis TaxID=72917 RepID=UPI001CB99C05|nr:eukaryotic translation initiation factor 4B3 [Erigeron canadensis]